MKTTCEHTGWTPPSVLYKYTQDVRPVSTSVFSKVSFDDTYRDSDESRRGNSAFLRIAKLKSSDSYHRCSERLLDHPIAGYSFATTPPVQKIHLMMVQGVPDIYNGGGVTVNDIVAVLISA